MHAGFAHTVITPDRPMYLVGHPSPHKSTGIYQELEATAAVFDDGARRVALLALDLINVDEYLLEPLRAHAATLGIPPGHLLINCSHTHCGPAVCPYRDVAPDFDMAYIDGLCARLKGLLAQAVADLSEVSLSYHAGSCHFGIFRRRVPEGATEAGFLPNPDVPIDPALPVVQVRTPAGELRALLFSYACHPTTKGGSELIIGPDYPGPARDLLRARIPGVLPIFLQGCGADVRPPQINPLTRSFTGGTVEDVTAYGHELARAVMATLCGTFTPLGDGVGASLATVDLPTAAQPTPEMLDAYAAMEDACHTAWARQARDAIARDGALPAAIPVEVQALRLGALTIVGMGGEICLGYGREIKRALAGQPVITLGYTGVQRCYVASRDEFPLRGYEVVDSFTYFHRPEVYPLGLDPAAADLLLAAALDQARAVAGCVTR